jgi:hypothetical protein
MPTIIGKSNGALTISNVSHLAALSSLYDSFASSGIDVRRMRECCVGAVHVDHLTGASARRDIISDSRFAMAILDVLDFVWIEDHESPLPHPAQDQASSRCAGPS